MPAKVGHHLAFQSRDADAQSAARSTLELLKRPFFWTPQSAQGVHSVDTAISNPTSAGDFRCPTGLHDRLDTYATVKAPLINTSGTSVGEWGGSRSISSALGCFSAGLSDLGLTCPSARQATTPWPFSNRA